VTQTTSQDQYQEHSPSDATPAFLEGGGEMGARMRAYAWATHPMGAPGTWPSLLKSTLRLVLTSNHPMFVWWGDDLFQFYNSASAAPRAGPKPGTSSAPISTL
jgi:hypothetical protein